MVDGPLVSKMHARFGALIDARAEYAAMLTELAAHPVPARALAGPDAGSPWQAELNRIRTTPNHDAFVLGFHRSAGIHQPDRRPARSLTYDPDQTARDIRDALADEWSRGVAGTRPCRCAAPHVPPRPDALAPWPVAVERTPLAYNTGIRRNAYRSYTPDFQKRWGS